MLRLPQVDKVILRSTYYIFTLLAAKIKFLISEKYVVQEFMVTSWKLWCPSLEVPKMPL